MLLPRVGWEAPIVYFDGNPDRPLALGRLYNGGTPPPYGLPATKATSTLQSATSPSNGSTGDPPRRRCRIHGGLHPRDEDQSVSVGGVNTVKVGVNETHDVTKSSQVGVDGAQSISIGGSQSVIVGAEPGDRP